MYEIIKSIINAGGYELEKLLHKIDLYHLEDKLTDEHRTELVALARENANAHNSYGAWMSGIDNNVWEPGAEGVHDFIWRRLRDV